MFDGKKVSGRWFTLLHAARDHGVRFRLNSGRRSIAEQWRLWWASKRGGPLAAYPSPTAPHIRVGRPDHALDVQQDDDGTSAAGGRERLQEWLRRRGLGVDWCFGWGLLGHSWSSGGGRRGTHWVSTPMRASRALKSVRVLSTDVLMVSVSGW